MQMLKYPLSFGHNTITSNPGHVLELRHIGFQNARLYGWFIEYQVEEEKPHVDHIYVDHIYVAVTGEHIPEGFTWHVGTAMHEYTIKDQEKGYYVVHAWK